MSHHINTKISGSARLPSPREIMEEVSGEHLAEHVINGREQIRKVLSGEDDRLLVIVGPCSIHDPEVAYEYAKRLARLTEQVKDNLLVVMRVYFEKPRTTVGWKGLIYDPMLDESNDIHAGLRLARRVLVRVNEIGVHAATELLDPITAQFLADLISWTAIGARTAESQTHRQMASGLSMPVGFKNGTGGTDMSLELAANGIEAAMAAQSFLGIDPEGRAAALESMGNPDVHLVLRGGRTGPMYDAYWVEKATEILRLRGLSTKLVVDCSHDNSAKDHERQHVVLEDVLQQRIRGDSNIAGVMMESNLNPGSQKLGPDLSRLKRGVSITDACIGWKETEELLLRAQEILREPTVSITI